MWPLVQHIRHRATHFGLPIRHHTRSVVDKLRDVGKNGLANCYMQGGVLYMTRLGSHFTAKRVDFNRCGEDFGRAVL